MNAESPATASGEVSDEVRAFYERRPYPAPISSLDRHLDLYRNPDRRRALFHLMWPTEQLRGQQEILVAGCGTSQAATIALREPDARVTAIDFSETSLRHLGDLQYKYKLENLEIRRLRIEAVHEIGHRFDQVVCTGVLHHLPEPEGGLRALRNVLEPEGAMHLMVYAAYGRTGIYMMQEYCRLLKAGVSDQALQDLAATLDALPLDHPINAVRRRAKDFTHPDSLADALLHPRDRAYTVPELYAWLECCGMSFGRWFEQAPYLPQCGVVATTPHAAELSSLPDPAQHAAVELFRGTMTQHSVIAYRDDYPWETQPIRFDSDRWRDYVPLRVPWTMCLRERVPHGFAAVLINRAHTCPDLALPIDAAQERLLDAIDGHRTMGELVQLGAEGSGPQQALDFFERLWLYDQIVFDASRSPLISAAGQSSEVR